MNTVTSGTDLRVYHLGCRAVWKAVKKKEQAHRMKLQLSAGIYACTLLDILRCDLLLLRIGTTWNIHLLFGCMKFVLLNHSWVRLVCSFMFFLEFGVPWASYLHLFHLGCACFCSWFLCLKEISSSHFNKRLHLQRVFPKRSDTRCLKREDKC